MFTGRIKNEQGAVVEQAIFIIPFADELEIKRTEEVKRTRHYFNADNPQASESEVMDSETVENDATLVIEYPMEFYHNGVARQQGCKPYRFYDEDDGVVMFSFEMTDDYAELYDRVNGTHQVKLMHVCEHHLKREIIPKHQ